MGLFNWGKKEYKQMARVLVVDDYQEHVDTLVQTLTMYGAETKGCMDAQEAVTLYHNWQPHLVIYDGLMEGMRAWEFAHKVLGSPNSQNNRPYLVALTGFASTLQRRLCEECGYNEYVTKPIELSTLLTWLSKAKERAMASQNP